METRRRTAWLTFGLGASLALNAGLAAWLCFGPNGPQLPPTAAVPLLSSRPSDHPEAAAQDATPAPTDKDASTEASPISMSFHWSQIESDDYRQYVANLRAVGCPEETIRDLISADLGALYTPRARAIWSPAKREYWQKHERGGPSPDQVRQLLALAREEATVSRELLGGALGPQDRIDALLLQLHGNEQQLLFLPEEKQAAALAVLREAGLDLREEELQSQGRSSSELEQQLFQEKLRHLAKVLLPEEVEEFRLRNSPEALWMRTELQYFACTTDEFKRLLDARQQDRGGGPGRNLLDRSAATEQVRALFGDARAAEFERVTDMHYQQARRATDQFGLSPELADQAWEISRQARQAAQQWATNQALPIEDRLLRVRTTQEAADRQLREVLGEKASRTVRRDLRVVLGSTEAGMKP